jgi:hypothetical protein
MAQEVDPKQDCQFREMKPPSFRLGERLLISRKLTGNFPDFDGVLPKEQPHTLRCLAKNSGWQSSVFLSSPMNARARFGSSSAMAR